MYDKSIRRSVLISGGSISGLTLAHWLRRYGFEVTLVERAPSPRLGGQVVHLGGAAKDVAERMGILPEIVRAHVHEKGLAYVDASGNWSATIPADRDDDDRTVAEIEILRGDLIEILYTAAQEEVEYLFDETITDLRETLDGVKTDFQRTESRVFDVVVGADGLHSNVRRLRFGPESDFVHDLGGYLSCFTVPAEELELDDRFLIHNAPGGLLAAIRPHGQIRAKAMFGFKARDLAYDRHDVWGQRQILIERFSEMGWHAPRLLAAMYQAPDFYFDTISQTHMDEWSRGRIALVGDAGYSCSPLSGHGTAMAMVGAYILAGELARAGEDHRSGFARYQDTLRPFVTACQKLPPGALNAFLPGSRAAIWMRNLSVRVMTGTPFRALRSKSPHKADTIALCDYSQFEPACKRMRP